MAESSSFLKEFSLVFSNEIYYNMEKGQIEKQNKNLDREEGVTVK